LSLFNINVVLLFFIFLIPFFEYGSYRLLPLVWVFWGVRVFIRKTIFFNRQSIHMSILFFFTLLIVYLGYISSSNTGRVFSLLFWSFSFFLVSIVYRKGAIEPRYFQCLFYFLAFLCVVDYVAYSVISIDISSYLGVESRHYTGAKPYVRSTGLFGEPGTQGIALLICFILSKPKENINRFIYICCSLITLSPYMLLGYTVFFKITKKTFLLMFVFISLFISGNLFIAEGRIYDLITLQDSSLLYRLSVVTELLNGMSNTGLYSTDVLLTDAGFIFEAYYEFGWLAIVYILLSPFWYFPFFMVLKIKTFSGWFFVYCYMKFFTGKHSAN
jgi:hypothetical protein